MRQDLPAVASLIWSTRTIIVPAVLYAADIHMKPFLASNMPVCAHSMFEESSLQFIRIACAGIDAMSASTTCLP